MKFVFGTHAVKRIQERHLNVDAVWQIALVGIVIERSGKRELKRGEFQGHAILVVIEQPNVIVTAYPEGIDTLEEQEKVTRPQQHRHKKAPVLCING